MDDQEGLPLEPLRQELERLRARVAELLARVAALEAENRQLREQLEAALKAAARQAAPFRRRQNKKVPEGEKKPPGRPAGHPGACRAVPEHVDDEVEVPLSACPQCGGEVRGVTRLEQYIEEIPPVRPQVVKVVTYRGDCPHCGEVFSTHPLQTSRGQGAAKVQLGPRALAMGACLNKQLGLTLGSATQALQAMAGLRITRGGLAQAMQRVAGKVHGLYQQWQERIRRSPAVYADETSWWVGGPGWWLWTFTTPEATLYRVDHSRGHEVAQQVLGDDFPGVLVSDCLASYDPLPYRKHKCIAHHLRAIAEARQRTDTPNPQYVDQWKRLFLAVGVISRARCSMPAEEYAARCAALEQWCDRLLQEVGPQPGDQAIARRLEKQRAHLFGCLYEPTVEPTNNRAERALRPAVIARKLSCGNKTARGRDCWEVLASLGATCRQRAIDFVNYLQPHLSLASAAS